MGWRRREGSRSPWDAVGELPCWKVVRSTWLSWVLLLGDSWVLRVTLPLWVWREEAVGVQQGLEGGGAGGQLGCGKSPVWPPGARGGGRGFVPSQGCDAQCSGGCGAWGGAVVVPLWDASRVGSRQPALPWPGLPGVQFWLGSPRGFCHLGTRAGTRTDRTVQCHRGSLGRWGLVRALGGLTLLEGPGLPAGAMGGAQSGLGGKLGLP